MTTLLLTATDNASNTTDQPDNRRISEHDADFQRLHDRTLRKLRASLRQLVRDLEATPWHLRSEREQVAARFIHRHTALIAAAYEAAHKEGQRDYYTPRSNTPSHWLRDVPQARLARTLRFYALGSVRRLAIEALAAIQPHDHQLHQPDAPNAQNRTTVRLAGISGDVSEDMQQPQHAASPAPDHTEAVTLRARGELNPVSTSRETLESRAGHTGVGSVNRTTTGPRPPEYITLADATDWMDSVDVRLVGQSQATWAGVQDGYYDGGLYDTANPYYYVFWDLEPAAKHCSTCPELAANSPYTPPGSGDGKELPATPGDGYTECGAGCKCSLRYGSNGEAYTALSWRRYREGLQQLKDAGLLDTERDLNRADTMPLREPPAGFASLFDAESMSANAGSLGGALQYDTAFQARAAQDAYRSVWDRWDIVRGSLPPLPKLAWMFANSEQFDALTFEQFIDSLPDRAAQTPEQRRVLRLWVEALLRLGGETGDEE